jgi:hypothetical protein
VGTDAAEHRRRLDRVGERLGVVGKGAGVDGRLGTGEARPCGDSGDRRRVVARDHLERHPLLGEVLERCAGVRADLVGEHHEGNGAQVVGEPVGVRVDRLRGVCEEQDAEAVGRCSRHAVGNGGERRLGQDHLGRTEQPPTVVLEPGGAPLAGRREGNAAHAGPVERRFGVAVGERLLGGIRVRVRPRDRGERVVDRGRVVLVGDAFDAVDHHRAFGDGAGLVEADHVDPGEDLDRRELLHEGSTLGEANDADRERHAREQHQALGHHADHAGDRGDERVADRLRRAGAAVTTRARSLRVSAPTTPT